MTAATSLVTAAPTAEAADVLRRVEELLAGHPPATTDRRAFLEAQFDAGLAWVHFPEGAGGLGLPPALQRVVDRALAKAGAPAPDAARNIIGMGMAAPTIAVHGTPEQRARYLRPLFSGEEIWCQLFSEPGAGSDLAGLATRAVRDGDEWVVTGQKVWTTLAHIARFGLLVTRTDPDLPKHLGLTYFICDMQAPGVDVRPLRQMTGDAEFNEVYLNDVRLSDDLRLGGEGDGWRVSMTTLMNERVSIGGGRSSRGSGAIAVAVGVWRSTGCDDPARRDRLMKLWVAAEVNRLTNIRAGQMRKAGTPGPEGSVAKLTFAELNQAISELCVDLMGAEGQLYTDYDGPRRESVGFFTGDPRYFFLRSRANSIEGGTSEVLRNILGERVLGLPGEPRTDKDLPWRDVPRS
ncbi:MAG TPA: acyl-CoA dehydrogenase family protein [Acidimicrobiia bacterium]|nr:acyl-CoA dehydrogenase family protein [Acidimicrobiia bacterium]